MPITTINTLGVEQLREKNQKVNKRLDEVQKFHFLISERNSTLRKFKAIHQGRVVYICCTSSCFLRGQISYFNFVKGEEKCRLENKFWNMNNSTKIKSYIFKMTY